MTDSEIVQLYINRDERAVHETKLAYRRLLYGIAYNILHNKEDAEECENDTCVKAWNSIPPNRPQRLCAYLCRIVRRLALDRYDYNNAAKRGTALPLEELEDFFASCGCAEDRLDEHALAELLNSFLRECDRDSRVIFLRRYWFGDSISDIAKQLHCTESRIKSRLSRTNKRLREFLRAEGYSV